MGISFNVKMYTFSDSKLARADQIILTVFIVQRKREVVYNVRSAL